MPARSAERVRDAEDREAEDARDREDPAPEDLRHRLAVRLHAARRDVAVEEPARVPRDLGRAGPALGPDQVARSLLVEVHVRPSTSRSPTHAGVTMAAQAANFKAWEGVSRSACARRRPR